MHADRASCAEAEIAAIAEHGSISEGKGYNIMGGGEGQQAGQNPRLGLFSARRFGIILMLGKRLAISSKGDRHLKRLLTGTKNFAKHLRRRRLPEGHGETLSTGL